MLIVDDSAGVAALCARLAKAEFVTVDTEFMRDRTYWPILCLVQLGGPDEAFAIDATAPGVDLRPVEALMADDRVLKVFHAARQDIEIFFHRSGVIPAPLFDTQVAAMVCGYGEQVSYETLAGQIAGARLDKSMRFTDWSVRPLTQRQIDYAIADVVHLRAVYSVLAARLQKTGRTHWLAEEVATLTDPATYRLEPAEAWRRLKPRGGTPRFFAILRELAAWREIEAQRRDVPRNRVLRDDVLLDIAAHAPTSSADLGRSRGLAQGMAEGRTGQDIVAAVTRGRSVPEADLPIPEPMVDLPRGAGPLIDLLKVLLKLKCERHDVAQKLVASSADLERIAINDDAPVPALHGWRREVFGEDALAVKHGRLALGVVGKRLRLVPIGGGIAEKPAGSSALGDVSPPIGLPVET